MFIKVVFSLMLIYIWFPVYQRSATYKTRLTNFDEDYPFPITSGRGKRKAFGQEHLLKRCILSEEILSSSLNLRLCEIPAGVNGWYRRERPGGPHYFRSCPPAPPSYGKDCTIAIGAPNLHKDPNAPISICCKKAVYTFLKTILKIVVTY